LGNIRKVASRAATLEKIARYDVDALVGALRGEDCGNEKLKRVRVL
jgi:hypothetical protein